MQILSLFTKKKKLQVVKTEHSEKFQSELR